jgi:hypothetical protein
MTIEDINKKRKEGDIQRVVELSKIPRSTIESVLYGRRKSTTKRGKEVAAWFSNFLECREQVTGDQK